MKMHPTTEGVNITFPPLILSKVIPSFHHLTLGNREFIQWSRQEQMK